MNEINKDIFTFISDFVKETFESKENEFMIGLYFGHVDGSNYGSQVFACGKINSEQQLMIAYSLLYRLKFKGQKISELITKLLSIANLDDLDIEEELCQSSKKS